MVAQASGIVLAQKARIYYDREYRIWHCDCADSCEARFSHYEWLEIIAWFEMHRDVFHT
jgi:hypothetical protein